MRSTGAVEGWLVFVIVVPSMVLVSGGVELTSFAPMDLVTRSVSSLMGMFEWNPGLSFMTGSA